MIEFAAGMFALGFLGGTAIIGIATALAVVLCTLIYGVRIGAWMYRNLTPTAWGVISFTIGATVIGSVWLHR